MSYSLYRDFNSMISLPYIVIDVETKLIDKKLSIRSQLPEFVMGGLKTGSKSYCELTESLINMIDRIGHHSTYAPPIVLVGHNISYDLICIDFSMQVLKSKNTIVWDTAIAHYMLTGQQSQYPSLNDVADYYGIGQKESEVSEMIKAGISPKNIPKDKLQNYLIQDIVLTEKIFKNQLRDIKNRQTDAKLNQFGNLVLQRMLFAFNTTRASCNGICIDSSSMQTEFEILDTQRKLLKTFLEQYMENKYFLHKSKVIDCNVDSADQITKMIFGGTYKVKEKIPTGEFYKTGPNKGSEKFSTKNVEMSILPMQFFPSKETAEFYKKCTIESSDFNVLSYLKDNPSMFKNTGDHKFIESLLEYRKINKELTTYYEPYLSLHITPNITTNSLDKFVYTDFKHTSTDTGRISCSKPNLQNVKSE